jgi:hypothetical protein
MRIFSIASVCSINVIIGLIYIVQIRRRQIKPALAMWIFFTIATVGSLLTYLADGDFSPLDNILNLADFFLVFPVSLAILFYGGRSTRFNRFDVGCLIAVVLILISWILTRQNVIGHSAIQLILVIAYFPVVKRMWRAPRNTESYVMWVGLMVAPIFSLLSSKGLLAMVYAVRSMVGPALLLLLMGWKAWQRKRMM